jgi:hypothetical protein
MPAIPATAKPAPMESVHACIDTAGTTRPLVTDLIAVA